MKKMKKIISLSMVAAMALSMTACGNSTSGSASSTEAKASSDAYHIGICQLLEHPALDAATKGFKEALEKELGKDKVVFDTQNAQGEQANCSTIINGFVSNKVDLIMANATPALQAASAATNTIPIVGTSVTDYATALNIDKWSGATGTNVTGTSDLAPLDQQAAMLKELIPNVKQVAIVYCSAEANSVYQANKIEGYLDKDNIKWKEYTAADSNEIQSVITKAVAECNAVYIPTDNTMAANTEIIKNVTVPAGVPVIAGEEGICKGGLATLSINYYDIGYSAGKMAAEILTKGTKPGSMDIQFAPKTTKEYNAQIAKSLNWKIPDGYKAIYTGEDALSTEKK